MAKAQSDSILERMRAAFEDALDADRARVERRRKAAQEATLRAERWAGFARDPDYGDTLAWRAQTLARTEGVIEALGDAPDATLATSRRVAEDTAGPEDEAPVRVVGQVAAGAGGGEARLVDDAGCAIASAPIDALGHYAIVAPATGETAHLEIRDAAGEVALLDGRALELTPGLASERNFKLDRCGQVEPAPEPAPDSPAMPDLVGKTEADAVAALKELGDYPLSFTERHDPAEPDTVIAQSPAAGRRLKAGAPVQLTVSLGPEPQQEMPKLIGLIEGEARKALAGLEYRSVQFAQVVEPRKSGRVVEQTPEPCAPLGAASDITLCIAIAARKMPEVVGKTLEDARALLVPDYVKTLKLEKVADDGPEGVVIGQSPEPGQEVGKDGVAVKVSTPVVPDKKPAKEPAPKPDTKPAADVKPAPAPDKTPEGGEKPKAPAKPAPAATPAAKTAPGAKPAARTAPAKKPAPAKTAPARKSAGSGKSAKPARAKPAAASPAMPDVTGMTRAAALKALKEVGISEPSFDAAAARQRGAKVIAQEPAKGAKLTQGQAVSLRFGKPK